MPGNFSQRFRLDGCECGRASFVSGLSVVNDAEVLARNLQSSPAIIAKDIRLSLLWNKCGASAVCGKAAQAAEAEFLISVHQDVYFRRGRFRAIEAVENLARLDPVAGLYGVKSDGNAVGHVWDSGRGRVWGEAFGTPVAVASLDELSLIVRRNVNVVVDPALSRFHRYGTNIVLTARSRDRAAYVVNVPAIHNSKQVRHLGRDYVAACRYMVRKWQERLPWPTVIVPLTRNPLRLATHRLRLRFKSVGYARKLAGRLVDPAAKAGELGFEPL